MYENSNNIINYIDGLEIKMTQDGKGRGVFAARDLNCGELLIVEKPIAHIEVNQILTKGNKGKKSKRLDFYKIGKIKLGKMIKDLFQLKGIQALRMSYLLNDNKNTDKIPPIKIYYENTYKKYVFDEFSDS